MSLPIFQVDAFSSKPFAGNPAAVCLLSEPRDDAWMLNVAREMNLSETAFLLHENDGYRLRWFTPTVEVSLCGHATLASAHVLFENDAVKSDQVIRFYTRRDLLTAAKHSDWIELNFPASPEEAGKIPDGIVQALGIMPRYVCKSGKRYMIEVETEEIVRGIQPDFAMLKSLPGRGVVVTSRASSPEFDFVSRYFAPWVGINEDPVTGSAHCGLAPYWSKRLGKNTFTAYQASARGGVLRVQLDGERVRLSGQAVTVLRGELLE
jgi:PhzF family phenazine biosynthesis protein